MILEMTVGKQLNAATTTHERARHWYYSMKALVCLQHGTHAHIQETWETPVSVKYILSVGKMSAGAHADLPSVDWKIDFMVKALPSVSSRGSGV